MIDPGISVVSHREETVWLCSTIGHTGWVAPLVVLLQQGLRNFHSRVPPSSKQAMSWSARKGRERKENCTGDFRTKNGI